MKNIKPLIKVHPSTYILILMFLLSGYFLNIILILIIVLFHELGHITITKLLKYKIKEVNIYPSGGLTIIEKPINSSISHDILIAIFGMIFQIILFGFFLLLYKYHLIRTYTYLLFKTYNKTILLFNLIPIIPLDGYQLLKSILEYLFSYKLSFYLSFIISFIAILLFITRDLFSINNYFVLSFLCIKMVYSLKNFKYEHFKFLLERHLYSFKYHRIKYEKKENIDYLKKDTYHYFKRNNTYVSEKRVLHDKYNL